MVRQRTVLAVAGLTCLALLWATGGAAAQGTTTAGNPAVSELETEDVVRFVEMYLGAFLTPIAAVAALVLVCSRGLTAVERRFGTGVPAHTYSRRGFALRLGAALGLCWWGVSLYAGGPLLHWTAATTGAGALGVGALAAWNRLSSA